MKITPIILTSFLLFVFSAGQMGCAVEEYAGPETYNPELLIPLAYQNQWNYSAKYVDDDSIYTHQLTIFDAKNWIDGRPSFTFGSTPLFATDNLDYKTLLPSTEGLEAIYFDLNSLNPLYADFLLFSSDKSKQWVVPQEIRRTLPLQHIQSYNAKQTGEQIITVLKDKAEITTEAGTFSCVVYHYAFTSDYDEGTIDVFEYYAPEVGRIAIGYSPIHETSSQTLPTFDDPAWSWSKLTSYSLN